MEGDQSTDLLIENGMMSLKTIKLKLRDETLRENKTNINERTSIKRENSQKWNIQRKRNKRMNRRGAWEEEKRPALSDERRTSFEEKIRQCNEETM